MRKATDSTEAEKKNATAKHNTHKLTLLKNDWLRVTETLGFSQSKGVFSVAMKRNDAK